MRNCSKTRRTLFVRFIVLSAILFGLLSLTSCDMLEEMLGNSNAPGTIYGYVVMEDGASKSGVSVTATNTDGTLTYNATTDYDGYFCIEQVTPADYTLSFRKTAYTDAEKSIKVKGGKNVDAGTITLNVSYSTITGKVTDSSGNPLTTKVTVTVSGSNLKYSAVADSKGNYSIKAKPGTYTTIKFDCTCWSAQYTLKSSIKLTASKQASVPDYKLPAHHTYVSDVDPETGNKINRCTVCDFETPATGALWAGIRYSEYGIRRSFGKDNYPTSSKTASLINKMQGCYEDSNGAIILIVGLMHGEDSCTLHFPTSSGYNDNYVNDSDDDEYEDLLTVLDNNGISVWLQVEPGNADLVKLAKEVMTHYKNHPCVKGFGIDVEWYRPAGTDGWGTKLTSSLANQVLAAVRDVKSDYTVFVKHWDWRWLPDATDGFIYVNDSQNFLDLDEDISSGQINALVGTISLSEANDGAATMKKDFSDWASHFAPCPVMFQIGYEKDKPIWKKLYTNPAKELGEYLLSGCTSGNDVGIIWVDFTLKEVTDMIPSGN